MYASFLESMVSFFMYRGYCLGTTLSLFFFIFYWEAGFEKATTRFSTSVRISLFGQLMYAIDSIGAEMATEKAQQAVLKGVEGFDPASLKPTETQEKVVLPGAAG